MNREECKQQIIERALAFNEKEFESGEGFVVWTAEDLSGAIADEHWNGEHPLDFDLALLAASINSRWSERHPNADPNGTTNDEAEECDEEGPALQAPNGTPWLLPMAGGDYDLDPFGVPHGRQKQGRRAGPISLDKFFTFKGKKRGDGDKPRFVCGYRLRANGKRKRYRPVYLIMQRYNAEQKWLNGEG